ncbi:MAG: urea carboxylase-associated family protein [Deltaproteobacteria bacterium]|nr:urea carboxylase-associated family protein [Deltaproteobacteria bacterium]MBI3079409.1 urea carboxylase-associated family protein [Deltaproteobacteria bacterium]
MADKGTAGVPGTVAQETEIPPREYLAVELRKGQVLRVIDLDGQQVPDVVCFNLHNHEERLSMNNTKLILQRWRITTGDPLYSDEGNVMLTIAGDTVGLHHLSGGCCNEPANFVRYGVHGTRNCLDNFTMALAKYDIPKKLVPGAFVPFMNVVSRPDGSYKIEEPPSRPGDYIDLRAEMDLLVAISNCPQDRNPCNAFNPTRLKAVVYEPRG